MTTISYTSATVPVRDDITAAHAEVWQENARSALLEEMGPEALVDSAAIAATFMHMDRIADGAGIAQPNATSSIFGDVIAELNLDSFASAKNSPGIGS